MCLFSPYPVERDGFVTVLAAVEEDVSCSFQDLQDELGVSGTQGNILGCLPDTSRDTRVSSDTSAHYMSEKSFQKVIIVI